MSDVKSLDHIATGIIEDRGYKLAKSFTVGPEDDVLDKHSQCDGVCRKSICNNRGWIQSNF